MPPGGSSAAGCSGAHPFRIATHKPNNTTRNTKPFCHQTPHTRMITFVMSKSTEKAVSGFKNSFGTVLPLIRAEWPQIDAAVLDETDGDYDRVVTAIATQTEHTRALVRKQLAELEDVASTNGSNGSGEAKRIRQMLEKLQGRSNELTDYVRKQMVTDAKKQVGDNPLVALLMAIGLGFVLGFILRSLGGRR